MQIIQANKEFVSTKMCTIFIIMFVDREPVNYQKVFDPCIADQVEPVNTRTISIIELNVCHFEVVGIVRFVFQNLLNTLKNI